DGLRRGREPSTRAEDTHDLSAGEMMAETNSPASANSAPLSKTARQQKIIDLITRQTVRSQIELAEALATQGITVTQATLSRDLAEVGAVKIRTTTGSVYAVPGEGGDRSLQQSTGDSLDAKLPRLLEELLVSRSEERRV